ncbi:hypothetical protein NKH18_48425 [Streptomyces sp. M10(2022)]
MPDTSEDVMSVLTERIEDRFQMPLADLRRAVEAAPQANPEATTLVHWHGLLAETQQALDTAEDALVEALGTSLPTYSTIPSWSWPTRSTPLSPPATAAPWS